jgi:16S rRNA (cytosine967-C5)-methyltransferase
VEGSSRVAALSEGNRITPRELALEILTRVDRDRAYADILLDNHLQRNALAETDRRLLTQLVYGTLRWRGRVDWVLDQLLERSLIRLEPLLRNLLRLAAYELLFLDRIPAYATVNEAVTLARKHGGKGKVGLANAVLRGITRRPGRDWVPDGSSREIARLAAFVSHPEWLVEMWCARYGLSAALRLMEANNAEALTVLRVNRLKVGRDELVERLRSHGIDAALGRLAPYAVRISRATVAGLAEFQEGLCQVQGEASQLAGCLLDVEPGMRVLDACAAPGGKTSQLAELMEDRGEVIATDPSIRGLNKLRESVSRLGLACIRSYQADASAALPEPPASFDRVLVDVPCSGLGTLRSHPEIKWRRTRKDIRRLARLQRKILEHTAPLVKPGGVVVYATCTLTAEENEGVVESFLAASDNFTVDAAVSYLPEPARHLVSGPYFEALPHAHDTEGFFAAVLRRSR